MIEITSAANGHVKSVVKLLKSGSCRHENGLFVAEGLRLVREIPKDRIKELYIRADYLSKAEEELGGLIEAAESAGAAFIVKDDAAFKKLSDTENPQGVVAVVREAGCSIDSILENASSHFIIIIEHLQDPGNLGTIIRTAEGAGVTGIVVDRSSADIYSPKAVRASMGSLFRMNILVSDNLIDDVRKLKNRGIAIAGMHLSGTELYEAPLDRSIGFMIGNEGNGLTDELSSEADILLRIPMEGRLESLNAGVSAAIVMYEAARQRRKNV